MTKQMVKTSNVEHVRSKNVHRIHLKQLLPDLMAGLIVGILVIIFSTSLASLIFSSNLSAFTTIGIRLTLLGAMIVAIVVTLCSSFSGTIAAPQEAPAALLALIAASISEAMPTGTPIEETFLTVVAAIALTSLLTGLLFLSLGYFKLGELIRFLPYPVIGGFLAGTGWLLVTGSINVMTDVSLTLSTLPLLFQTDILLRWLPALIFAILLLVILNRNSHFLLLPSMIFGAVALFYFVMWMSNTSFAELSAQGWLIEPVEQGLSQSFSFSDITRVNWEVVYSQIANVPALLVISAVALLLSASGIELIVGQDIDLNRELQAAGIGNVLCGLCGGLVGFHVLSESTLSQKIGGKSRLVGGIVAVLCGLVIFGDISLIYFFPKTILGSMLMMLGLSFLFEWVYQSLFKFPLVDYLIILAILLAIAVGGFLQGIVFGVVMVVVLFVVNYSRINVVKHSLSAAYYKCRVTRHHIHCQILEEKENEIHIFQLHGFIFFGTANNLLNQVRQRIEARDLPRVRFMVLDFRQVTGLDSTAAMSFSRMIQYAQEHQIVLVFTNPSTEVALPGQANSVARFFDRLNDTYQGKGDNCIRMFPNLDYGLEWCEKQILTAAGINLQYDKESLLNQLRILLPDTANVESLLIYFERLDVGPGYNLIEQGDLPEHLFFIESGRVIALFESADSPPFKTDRTLSGGVVGEVEFYLNKPSTATVVTDEPSTIYRLSRQTLKQMEQDDPKCALTFQLLITCFVSERLNRMINTVNYLQ